MYETTGKGLQVTPRADDTFSNEGKGRLFVLAATTQIRAGENAGKVLRHDFVVLAHHQYSSDNNRWHITDKPVRDQIEKAGAVVVWVTEERNPTPVQMAGGWVAKQLTLYR